MKKDFFREPKERKVYEFKNYQTEHILLVPLMFAAWGFNNLKAACEGCIKWKPQTANKILTRYIDKMAERCIEDDKQYLYIWLRNWWGIYKFGAMPWQKMFAKKFKHQISEYLVEEFELEGFTKVVEPDLYHPDTYEIYFYKEGME